MSKAADTKALLNRLAALLGGSASFWPSAKAPQLDDLYEVYLWAETIRIAKSEFWTVDFVNAGRLKDEFTFRKGPGLLTSTKPYTYALLSHGSRSGELHVGIRVRGLSSTLHEYDVVALDSRPLSAIRGKPIQPDHWAVRLHIEAKFHTGDLALGIGRSMVGLKADCPSIEPFLVSKGEGSESIRPLIKHHNGHYVHNMFPARTGRPYFERCIEAALGRWR
jgi:hypothetical protein